MRLLRCCAQRGLQWQASGSDVEASRKPGTAHLRRIVVEGSMSELSRRPPGDAGMDCAERQESISEEVKEIAWKKRNTACTKRYMKLGACRQGPEEDRHGSCP